MISWKSKSKKEMHLLSIFKTILKDHYVHTANTKYISYSYFKDITPEALLAHLSDLNPKFHYSSSFFAEAYLSSMLELLRVRYLMLDAVPAKNGISFRYSMYYSITGMTSIRSGFRISFKPLSQKEQEALSHMPAPEVVVVYMHDKKTINPEIMITESRKTVPEILKLPGRRTTYRVDSVLIGSFNQDQCDLSHQICGITCNDKRYIYNGWLRNHDPHMDTPAQIPCELMEMDWIHNTETFKLSESECKTKLLKWYDFITPFNKVIFNMNQGSRTYIYTKVIK